MAELTQREKEILWHSLGLNPAEPWQPSHRNNFAAGGKDVQDLRALVAKGLMHEGGERWGLVYFRVTPAGMEAAKDALPRMSRRRMRNRQRYLRFLDVSDCCPDMTFRDFLRYEKEREVQSWA